MVRQEVPAPVLAGLRFSSCRRQYSPKARKPAAAPRNGEREAKSHVGADRERESTEAMGNTPPPDAGGPRARLRRRTAGSDQPLVGRVFKMSGFSASRVRSPPFPSLWAVPFARLHTLCGNAGDDGAAGNQDRLIPFNRFVSDANRPVIVASAKPTAETLGNV